MKTIFRATTAFMQAVRADLERWHPFAGERVAFISIRATQARSHLVLLAESYHPVADEDYIDDPRVGAMMSQEAIRKALEVALLHPVGMFHVHMHGHKGRPRFSGIDRRENLKFVPDFFKVRPELPHGAIVVSRDRATGQAWLGPNTITEISEFNTIGSTLLVDREPGSTVRGHSR